MYDIIIIGSGLGALECAQLLTKQGHSVLVLERQLQAGGCLQSYRRGGIDLDTGLHYVGGLAEGQTLHNAFEQLGLLALPWKQLPLDNFDTVTICGDSYKLCQGYNEFVEGLAEHFPTQRQALKTYVDVLSQVDHAPATQDSIMKWGTINAWEWLHETFTDERLINVLSGTALKMELRKETLPLFTFAHVTASFIESSWRLQGSGNMLIDSLVQSIRQGGGEVVCGIEVEELIEVDGQIKAARCSNGETYEGRCFISGIHPALTTVLVRESSCIKKVYRNRLKRLENTYGMFTASLKLKPESTAQNLKFDPESISPTPCGNHYVYTTEDVWSISEQGHAGDGILISPQRADNIDILTPMRWDECEQWADTKVGRRGDDYKAFKQQRANEIIKLAETQMPGLSDRIEAVYTSTPLTWRDYNLTPDGSAYGIRKDCQQPLLTILTPRTPVPNLFLTGQSLMVHGLQGTTMTALATIQEVNNFFNK